MSDQPLDMDLLLKVLRDLEDFLPHLVLVGGWVPLLYSRYLWKETEQEPLATIDIDFGFKEGKYKGKETITDRIIRKEYREHHVRLGHDFPFVPIAEIKEKGLKADVEFITEPGGPSEIKDRLIGHGILINEIKDFQILLEKIISVNVEGIKISVPAPSHFVFHKLMTFSQRRGMDKRRKDLYYAYYVLLICPQKDKLNNEIKHLIKSAPIGKNVKKNIKTFFEDSRSKGPNYIEEAARQTNLALFVEDLPLDSFQRIHSLIEH